MLWHILALLLWWRSQKATGPLRREWERKSVDKNSRSVISCIRSLYFFTLQRFSKDAKISWLVSAKFWQNFMRILALTIMDWIIIASIFTSIFYHNKRHSFVQRIELKRMRKESPQKTQSMRRRRRRGKSAWKIWFMHVHVCSVSVQRNIFSNYESK